MAAVAPHKQDPPSEAQLLSFKTRFLYPFFFEGKLDEVATALRFQMLRTANGKDWGVWSLPDEHGVPDLYVDELLPQVRRAIFGDGEKPSSSLYASVRDDLASAIFKNITFPQRKVADTPIRLDQSGVELFVNRFGVGVLSFALELEANSSIEAAIQLNYALSQTRPFTTVPLRRVHPSENKKKWESMPVEQRERVATPVPTEENIQERILGSGAGFTLTELSGLLLSGLTGVENVQQNFSVYSVAHFGRDAEFKDSGLDATISKQLSGLVQIEEVGHAGSDGGAPSFPHAVLNRKHLFGAGQIGAVHFIADQHHPPDNFDGERPRRVMLKYFVPYLEALLQRLTLQRIAGEACELVRSGSSTNRQSVLKLYQMLLDFDATAHFHHVSSREVLHRYYNVCLASQERGLRYDEARKVLAEIQEHNRVAESSELLNSIRALEEKSGGTIGALHAVQARVEAAGYVLLAAAGADIANHIRESLDVEGTLGICWLLLGATSGVVIGYVLAKLLLHK
jgi:hypothetical protein